MSISKDRVVAEIVQDEVVVPKTLSIFEAVTLLETHHGFLDALKGKVNLFAVEMALGNAVNKDLKDRWEKAIAINIKVRMRLLRSKALSKLENYENLSPTSSAPDIAYCKTLLSDVLTEGTERIKAKYAVYKSNHEPGVRSEDDEMTDVEKDLE